MSQKNVEIAERLVEAFNRRDPHAYDFCTPDFEWSPALVGGLEGSSYRGREGAQARLGEIHETWHDYRLVPGEFRDLGDRVLMLGRQEGRGRGSGVPVDAPFGVIFDLRGGKVSRMGGYLDHGEALRAAGLTE